MFGQKVRKRSRVARTGHWVTLVSKNAIVSSFFQNGKKITIFKCHSTLDVRKHTKNWMIMENISDL